MRIAAIALGVAVLFGAGLARAVTWVNETDLPNEADYANLQFPTSLTGQAGTNSGLIFGQIYELNKTEAAGPNATISADLGYGPDNTDPRLSNAWLWFPATYNVQSGNNDEYVSSFTFPIFNGTYRYTFRYSLDGGTTYTAGDINGAGSNPGLTFETSQLGVMNVNGGLTPEPASLAVLGMSAVALLKRRGRWRILPAMRVALTADIALRFATLTLNNVTREYPNVLLHVMAGPEDARTPRELHPIFFGCFDWHSCVHGYWQLARLARLFPEMPPASAIARQFDEAFTSINVAAEQSYFEKPIHKGFERPYGWAWLLALASELSESASDDRRRWHAAIVPLAQFIAHRFIAFLPRAIYPIRIGTHPNFAFAMTLAHEYAPAHGDRELKSKIDERVRSWFSNDVDCQAWEPSLDEFLSPALMEAACMQTVLPADEFREWFDRFLPRLHERSPRTLFTPAVVSDRTDGKIAHLDGLNFSRAWCMRRIASALPRDDVRATILRDSAADHFAASFPHVADDYAGEHWLATFAVLACS